MNRLSLNIFEIFDCIRFKLISGGIITNNYGMRMVLQNANRPLMTDSSFNTIIKRFGFFGAGGKDLYLTSIHNCADTDGHCRAWNLADIIIKETRVYPYSVGG